MSDGLLFTLSFVGVFVGGPSLIMAGFYCNEYEWSLTLWRAARKRRREIHDRAAVFLGVGYSMRDALKLAEQAMEREADANRKELEAIVT